MFKFVSKSDFLLTSHGFYSTIASSAIMKFAKFLIDRKGNVVERFAPTAKPNTLEAAIEARLQEQT